MTTTTLNNAAHLAPVTSQKACLKHGMLAADAQACPRCTCSVYRLDDEGDRATVKSFRKAAAKVRLRNFAIGGAAAVLILKAAFILAATGVLVLHFDLGFGGLGAVMGALAASIMQTGDQRALDRALTAP